MQGNPTYEALSGSHTFKLEDTQYTMTAEEMGYQKYFDHWKEQGLFNKRVQELMEQRWLFEPRCSY